MTISFNLRPGYALGDAVAAVEQTARETLPATVVGSFQGTAQAFQSSTKGLGLILIMAIFVIYVVLGILYESFIHPLTILSGLPAAGFGALLTLMFFKSDLNLYAFVGVIMLVGLVKKNGIMMIDFAIEARRTEGKSAVDAIYEACLVRFRPIMMTTMAALAGTLPIALGIGAGAEARRPLGLAVVGGLVVSQTLTLYLTPVFYTYMEGLSGWLARERPREVKFDHPQEATGASGVLPRSPVDASRRSAEARQDRFLIRQDPALIVQNLFLVPLDFQLIRENPGLVRHHLPLIRECRCGHVSVPSRRRVEWCGFEDSLGRMNHPAVHLERFEGHDSLAFESRAAERTPPEIEPEQHSAHLLVHRDQPLLHFGQRWKALRLHVFAAGWLKRASGSGHTDAVLESIGGGRKRNISRHETAGA